MLRVNMPGVSSSATLTLEISTNKVFLHVPNSFQLNLPLNYNIEKGKSSAKFDTTKQQLVVTMPVVTAAPAAAVAAAELPTPAARIQPAPSAQGSVEPTGCWNSTSDVPATAAVRGEASEHAGYATATQRPIDVADTGRVSFSSSSSQSSACAAAAAAGSDSHCSCLSSSSPVSPWRSSRAYGGLSSSFIESHSDGQGLASEGCDNRPETGFPAAAEAAANAPTCSQPPGKSAAQLAWEQLHAEHDKTLTQQRPQQQEGVTAEGGEPSRLQVAGVSSDVGLGSQGGGIRSSISLPSGVGSSDSPRQGGASASSPRSAQAKVRAAAAKLMPRLLGARKQAQMLD